MNLLALLKMYQSFLSGTNGQDRAEIVLETTNKKVRFPVPPAELPPIKQSQNNGVFSSVVGDMSTIGLLGLRSISLDSLLCPSDCSKYSFAKGDDGQDIINAINDGRKEGKPFRIVITKGNTTYVNMQCLVDDFDYYNDKLGNYVVSLSLSEYIERSAINVASQSNTGQ